MKANRLIALIMLISIIILSQFYLASIFGRLAPRIEINALDYGISKESSITLYHLRQMENQRFSYVKNVGALIKNTWVNVAITNENFVLFNEIILSYGSFFSKNAASIGLNLAVISEELSFDLYNTTNATGNEIKINGLTYTICGIYRQSDLLRTLSYDGMELVFVPQKSDIDQLYAINEAIKSIMLIPNKNTGPFITFNIDSELNKITLNSLNYRINDFTKATVIIKQFAKISFFVSTIILIIFVLEYILKDAKYNSLLIMKKIKTTSLIDAILEKSVYFMLILTKWLGLIVACIILYRICVFDLHIPNKYIPSERLFDFNFYKQIFLDIQKNNNIYYAYKATTYEKLYQTALYVNLVATIVNILLSCKLFMNLRYIFRRFTDRYMHN